MFIRWYTWLRMILPHTVSPLAATSSSIQFFARHITCTFYSSSMACFLTSIVWTVGIQLWRKRVALKCKLKESLNSARPSHNYLVVWWRTPPLFKLPTGKNTICSPLTPWLITSSLQSNRLLTSGWWAYSRKPNYVADWTMSLTWGAIIGTTTIIPYFYSVFFFVVLLHRCTRDFER